MSTDDGELVPEVEGGVSVPVEVLEGIDRVMGIAIVATVTGKVTGRGVPGLLVTSIDTLSCVTNDAVKRLVEPPA